MAATIRSAITVSLVPEARGGPFVFWDGLAPACKRAAALGFDAVEIFPPGAQSLSGAGAIAKEHGLRFFRMSSVTGEGLKRAAHRIAGTVGIFNAGQALALAREVEARAPERSPELPERVEALCAELSRLESELMSRSAQLVAG